MGNPVKHKLIAGILCLDFVNTINGHNSEQPNEYIHNYQDLIQWSTHAGVIGSDQANFLLDLSTPNSKKYDRTYQLAISFRENLFQIFSCLNSQKPVPFAAVQSVSKMHHAGINNSELIQKKNRFRWKWKSNQNPEMIIWPIASSATSLLTSEKLKWVRECSGSDCDWYFLDTSRNHQRRWCSMADCGNRYKMKQRRIRQKNH